MVLNTSSRGFALLDALVVVGFLAVLTVVIAVAVHPAERLQQARDDIRKGDVLNLVEAISEYRLQHHGAYPSGLDRVNDTFQVLGVDAAYCDQTCSAEATSAACLDLSADLSTTALGGVPIDPKSGIPGNSDYAVNLSGNGRLTVIACDPEGGEKIEVQR